MYFFDFLANNVENQINNRHGLVLIMQSEHRYVLVLILKPVNINE